MKLSPIPLDLLIFLYTNKIPCRVMFFDQPNLRPMLVLGDKGYSIYNQFDNRLSNAIKSMASIHIVRDLYEFESILLDRGNFYEYDYPEVPSNYMEKYNKEFRVKGLNEKYEIMLTEIFRLTSK